MKKKVVLGITGSVASVLVLKIADSLIKAGYEVKIVATMPSLYFLPTMLEKGADGGQYIKTKEMNRVEVFLDKDEWPEGGYHKGDPVRHIEFRTETDILLIAPLSANTLAKITYGFADNFLSCIVRAWPKHKPLILAPAMNTEMWEDPITEEQLIALGRRFKALEVVDPADKNLACGDSGKGAMANIDEIVKVVNKYRD